MYKIIGADGREYGPITADQLGQWIRDGRANAQTLVQTEGGTEWKPLGLFPEFATTTAASGATPPPLAPPTTPPSQVPNYLVPAILSTVCCCLPFGVVAIIFAAQVNSKLQAGDIPGAMEASQKAKTWCWVAFACGIIVTLLWLPVMRLHAFRMHRGW